MIVITLDMWYIFDKLIEQLLIDSCQLSNVSHVKYSIKRCL